MKVLAKVCLNCPVCRRARKRQAGLCHWLVRKVERKACPFCRAYARAFGKQPHAPI